MTQAAFPDEIPGPARQEAEARFKNADMDHPAMPVLKKMVGRRLAERLARDPHAHLGGSTPMEEASAGEERDLLERKLQKQPLGPLDMAMERLKLPTLPQVWIRLRDAMDNPDSTATDLARIIGNDPKLTVTVLSLVNSPLFSLPVKVETLSRAVTVLGTREISGLALGSLLVTLFQDVPPDVLDAQAFWTHSVATAILARNLALFAGFDEPERFFVAGLLHDLGRVALFSSEPELARLALVLERMGGLDLAEAESKVFDFDHAMLGAMLLQKWHMPAGVVQAALCHHSAERCLRNQVSMVVHVANALVVSLGLGSCGERHAPHMGREAFARLNISPEELPGVVAEMDRQMEEILPTLVDG